jgi:2-oxoglutarate ferredoxin oxidoreductase subunit beta
MTSFQGNIEPVFDLCELVKTSGASYVARWTTAHPRNVINSIKKGISKRGFAFIEIVSQCPTQYGRRNRLGDGVQMMKWLRKNSVGINRAKEMNEAELNGKYIVGEFVDRDGPEWVSSLWELGKRLRGDMT